MASFIWLCGPITGFVVSHSRENNAIFFFLESGYIKLYETSPNDDAPGSTMCRCVE